MNDQQHGRADALTTTKLPDGSGFAVASLPLPQDHWLYASRCAEWDSERDTSADTPHPILTHAQRDAVVAAVRYAIRSATMCGQDMDFDPDALVLNAVYALCGPFSSLLEDNAASANETGAEGAPVAWMRIDDPRDCISDAKKRDMIEHAGAPGARLAEKYSIALGVITPAQAAEPVAIPAGWRLVPIEPTESMVVNGFESWPDEFFSDPEVWDAFEKMTGCQQAAHKAQLCYAAMLASAPQPPAQADAPADTACPHAGVHRYCMSCPVSPCPIGLGEKK